MMTKEQKIIQNIADIFGQEYNVDAIADGQVTTSDFDTEHPLDLLKKIFDSIPIQYHIDASA